MDDLDSKADYLHGDARFRAGSAHDRLVGMQMLGVDVMQMVSKMVDKKYMTFTEVRHARAGARVSCTPVSVARAYSAPPL